MNQEEIKNLVTETAKKYFDEQIKSMQLEMPKLYSVKKTAFEYAHSHKFSLHLESSNFEFINDHMDKDVERDILLKTLNLMDIKKTIEKHDPFYSVQIILHVNSLFRNLKKIGLNPLCINKEITDTLEEVYPLMMNSNGVIAFIHEGFAFKRNFVNDIKDSFFKTFIVDTEKNWHALETQNNQNNIKLDAKNLMQKMSVFPTSLEKKKKI